MSVSFDACAAWVFAIFAFVGESARIVVLYPLTPMQRLWIPFVITSGLIGAWVYVRSTPREERGAGLRGVAGFLFPASVWRHRSSWVDLCYFFPHQMVRIWIYGAFSAALTLRVATWTQGTWEARFGVDPLLAGVDSLGVRVGFTLIAFVLIDLTAYLAHLMAHKVPFLWEFHRVHHSARVLNPLTTYREHPVENLLFAAAASGSTGVLFGSLFALFGAVPTPLGLLGIGVPMLLFNSVGYHLRHSHVWLRWPGVWGIVFGSPAHHQIHHSCLPEHIDKNLAFAFPIWDRIFGTLCLPDDRPEMVFGIGDGSEPQYDGFLRIYALPFERLFERYVRAPLAEGRLARPLAPVRSRRSR